MDTFDWFGCDPVYMDASAQEPVTVDSYRYPRPMTSGDIQQQEMWLCGFMNEETGPTRSSDFLPSSLPYPGDFSVAPYHAICNEAPIAVERDPLSEIQLYTEVYNSANANA